MKKYEKRIQPAREYNHLVSRACDLCGRLAKNEDWDHAAFEVDETEIQVTIKSRQGASYPEGGNTTETSIDICPDCFKSRLVPWLQSQGASVREEEFDW